MPNDASEALVAQPLPEMIQNLGLAVAKANEKMAENEGVNRTVFAVNEATIELNIAVAMETKTDAAVGGSFGINAFSVNASYARSYNFKEEASSKITLHLSAVPPKPQ